MNRLLFIVLLFSAALPAASGQSASLNDQARFLAGLPVRGSGLEDLARDRVWVEHATEMDKAWGKQQERQIARVRSWAATFLPNSRSSGTMYYMFSGPDFLYADAFYPNASTYILCGTEPVGSVPDIARVSSSDIAPALANLRTSLGTILSFHYFITKEMRVDLSASKLGGTLPILYVFLARTGHTINDVTYVSSPAPGVRIGFSGDRGKQMLYYFKTDLSNGGGSSGFLKWCAQQGPGLSLLKAASYLPHSSGFSTVRNFLLQNSRVIVQDDSGIPLAELQKAGFKTRLFGDYKAPIELFAKNYQADLAQAYKVSNPAPLGFAFGYHWQPQLGMLMVATPQGSTRKE